MRSSAMRMASKKQSRLVRSLALNVHFKHDELGMKEFEILSRATAFLLSVDPPEPEYDPTELPGTGNPYDHLQSSQRKRDELLHKQNYSPKPAGGPRRQAKDLNWLEFCPGRHRPLVHVVASSHVLSPWLWKNYYPQPWLDIVKQEHVRYSLEVMDVDVGSGGDGADGNKRARSLAKFALNPYPIHHPDRMDLAVVHLKNEETALKHMTDLGVQILHLTDTHDVVNRNNGEDVLQKGSEVLFDGFQIAEEHYETVQGIGNNEEKKEDNSNMEDSEDTRVFMPYTTTGKLIYGSPTRFLATTSSPLPEGLCGGPTVDPPTNTVCGVIEGIVPATHDDERIAGAASFIPYFQIRSFLDFAERHMLEQILPEKLFKQVVDIKCGKALNQKSIHDTNQGLTDANNQYDREQNNANIDRMYHDMVQSMRQAHTPQEVEAILGTMERQQQEIMDIIKTEGGDLDEIIARVQNRTLEQQRLHNESKDEEVKIGHDDNIIEAEIIDSNKNNDDDDGDGEATSNLK